MRPSAACVGTVARPGAGPVRLVAGGRRHARLAPGLTCDGSHSAAARNGTPPSPGDCTRRGRARAIARSGGRRNGNRTLCLRRQRASMPPPPRDMRPAAPPCEPPERSPEGRALHSRIWKCGFGRVVKGAVLGGMGSVGSSPGGFCVRWFAPFARIFAVGGGARASRHSAKHRLARRRARARTGARRGGRPRPPIMCGRGDAPQYEPRHGWGASQCGAAQ